MAVLLLVCFLSSYKNNILCIVDCITFGIAL